MWNWVKTILRVFSGATSEQEKKAMSTGASGTSETSSVKQEITQVASMQEAYSKTAIETRKDANPQETEMHPIASLIIPIKAPNSEAPAPDSGAPFSIFTSIATVLVNLTETLTKKSPEEEAFQRLIDKKISELMLDRPQTTHENLNQYLQQQEQGIRDGVTKECMEKRSANDPDFMKLLQIEKNLLALLEQRTLSAQSKPGAGENGEVNQHPQQPEARQTNFGFTSETKTRDRPEAEKPPTRTHKKVPKNQGGEKVTIQDSRTTWERERDEFMEKSKVGAVTRKGQIEKSRTRTQKLLTNLVDNQQALDSYDDRVNAYAKANNLSNTSGGVYNELSRNFKECYWDAADQTLVAKAKASKAIKAVNESRTVKVIKETVTSAKEILGFESDYYIRPEEQLPTVKTLSCEEFAAKTAPQSHRGRQSPARSMINDSSSPNGGRT